jgi:hypothetical protein
MQKQNLENPVVRSNCWAAPHWRFSGQTPTEHTGKTVATPQPVAVGTQAHSNVFGAVSIGAQLKPGSHVPPQEGGPAPPTQGMRGKVVVVVLDVDVVVDVVVVGGVQPPAAQASQQLVKAPMHALPPAGAEQAAALRLSAQRVAPPRVRQQVTNPGRPQVERAAHRRTARTQAGDRARCRATSSAHRT